MNAHRYTLTREFLRFPGAFEPSTVAWVMLNPSTADDFTDDPTIRRCIGFSKRGQFDRLVVLNLNSERATKPKDLTTTAMSAANAAEIKRALPTVHSVIFAWGATPIVGKAEAIHSLQVWCAAMDLRPWCLGVTADGSPRHPLYVRGDAPLIRWPA